MNAMRPVLCTCLLLLTGCANVSRPVFPHHYALIAPAAQVPTNPISKPGHGTLQVARIEATPWLQGTRIYYRLDYRHNARVGAYADSDWLAPPARMLEPLIRDALARDGRWQVVLGPGTPANADATLHIRLDDFDQVFTSPQQSEGVLDVTATLVDAHSGDALAQKHFHVEMPAPSADAAGGAAALNRAGDEFIGQLRQWLHGTMTEHWGSTRKR